MHVFQLLMYVIKYPLKYIVAIHTFNGHAGKLAPQLRQHGLPSL